MSLIINRRKLISCVGSFFKRYTTRMSHDASEDRPDHLERTADSGRQQDLQDAVVTEIVQLSPTVKGLTLRVMENFSFKAGQWVDFFIDGVEIFTGYSMVSAPDLMNKNNTLKLAIKFSDYPPTEWVHKQCKVGSKVKVRVGGDFFYDPKPTGESHNLLLVAGGVGINPLLSAMRHAFNLKLVFKDQIDQLCTKCSDLRTTYHVTKETPSNTAHKVKRIDQESLLGVLSSLQGNANHLRTECYLCGPGPMIDDTEKYLTALGVDKENIHYEKWW